MARLIDADIALENIDEWLDTVGTALIGRGLSYYAELQGCIEDAPTVDAVPVVRCKDCKFYQNHGLRDIVFDKDACHWNADEQPDPDDFCSCGERRG
nr:MAG TPA: hypothetical protein [Caudoviricetes sp.]